MRLRIRRKLLRQSNIRLFLAILGPGLIAAAADNDATGIYGYSLAGAAYKYEMLWVLVIVTFSLAVMQEIGARMGAVTGKGLADLIREQYGVKITLFAMITLLVANFSTTVAEFAGVEAAAEVFAPNTIRFIVVPLAALAVWLFVTRGSYRSVERPLIIGSAIYFAYVISALLAHPRWGEVLHATIAPNFGVIHPLGAYIFMVINVVGTTITPWGQFYIQSSVRDKGITTEDYGYERTDVFFGAFFTNFIAYFIIACCGATLFMAGIHNVNDAGQAALALKPLAGGLATILFAIGLLNASLFGAITVPLSTAYAITEALGWESGIGRRIKEAPLFIGIFTFLIAASALIVMFLGKNLTLLIILPNIIGGILLPIILILTIRLVNNREIMGRYTNSRTYNLIAWITVVVLILLSLVLLVTSFLP